MKIILPGILILLFALSFNVDAQSAGIMAAKPLYRDPVYDGAADPVVVWNSKVKRWWMFYTNRRANVANLSGVAWVHGTPIGIAESSDNGAHWKYVGTANIDVPELVGSNSPTFWAPDVTRQADGKWSMFLTIVPGIFENWQHPRQIVRLTSADLQNWKYVETLKLSSDRVIDPAIMKMPGGMWRLWYNDERDKKSIYSAESRDLKQWTDHGKAINDKPGEGPKVFRWQNKFWMIVDQWHGLGVYRSDDANNWEAQSANLLTIPGTGADDQIIGGHPDVVVSGKRAFLFYFTHPGRRPDIAKTDVTEQRRSSIQVVELKLRDGWLACDRDEPTYIELTPRPINRRNSRSSKKPGN